MLRRGIPIGIALALLLPVVCQGTFSIVAYDPDVREWGVAVASREIAVGAMVPWAEAGAGAVVTQALIDPAFGVEGLSMMKSGMTADEALATLLEADGEDADQRQLALVDAAGGVAAFSGARIGSFSGSRQGEHYSVQGNTLVGEAVLVEMENAFLKTDGPLALRLLEAILAGDAAGGDRRGRQSAALYVARENGDIRGVTDHMTDLRIDNHPDAPRELAEAFMQWAHQILVFTYLDSESGEDVARGEKLMEWVFEYERDKDEPKPVNIHRMARFMMMTGVYPDRALELRREHFSDEWKNDAVALNQFAWFCFQYGVNLEEAETLARRGVALSEGSERANVLDTLAEIVNARGNTAEAVDLIEQAIALAPETVYYQNQRAKFQAALESGPSGGRAGAE